MAFGRCLRPVKRFFEPLTAKIRTSLQSASPVLVSLLVCLAVLPVLSLISLFAGIIVWLNIPTGFQAPVYLQYGDGTTPYAILALPKLHAKLPYDISLQLTVPATESNYALGNFMTSLRLYASTNNETLVDVRRASLILPPSSTFPLISRPHRYLKHEILILSSHVPRMSQLMAHIELGRRDGWRSITGSNERELSVVDASLHGEIRPRGLTKVAYVFPVMTSVASSATFFVVAGLVVMTYLLSLGMWDSSAETYGRPLAHISSDTKGLDEKGKAPISVDAHDRQPNNDLDIKIEPDGFSSPEIDASPSLTRRRSTRLTDER